MRSAVPIESRAPIQETHDTLGESHAMLGVVTSVGCVDLRDALSFGITKFAAGFEEFVESGSFAPQHSRILEQQLQRVPSARIGTYGRPCSPT